jgi:putative oxidoreductase
MTSFYASLERWRPQILSILRIVVALLFIQHGTQKFFGFPGGGGGSLSTLSFIQGVLEFGGGILLLLGVYTRLVAFILSGDMAVAYFMAHYPSSFYPIVNKGDLAILFSFVFLYIFFAGGGAWSVDRSVLKQE